LADGERGAAGEAMQLVGCCDYKIEMKIVRCEVVRSKIVRSNIVRSRIFRFKENG